MAKSAKKNILKFWGIHFVPKELAATPAAPAKAGAPKASAPAPKPTAPMRTPVPRANPFAPAPAPVSTPRPATAVARKSSIVPPPAPRVYGKDLTADKKQQLLDELRERVERSPHCGLEKTRTKLVFGEGDPNADIVFIGEAPGFDEDQQGRPFVGRAGQLLTDIIVKGMGIGREKVYICNVLKCRPPQNRVPTPEEIHICSPWLIEQLQIIHPKVIIALGASAVRGILPDVSEGITKIRGQFYEYHLDGPGTNTGDVIQIMPTFHPAYLLRNPPAKKYVWDDIQKVMTFVGLPIPGKKNT
jgi:DNA polymerase